VCTVDALTAAFGLSRGELSDQHDVVEVYQRLLEVLEVAAAVSGGLDDAFSSPFQLGVASTVTLVNEKGDIIEEKAKSEMMTTLSLAVPSESEVQGVDEILERSMKEEHLTIENWVRSEVTGKREQTVLSRRFASLSPILCLHLLLFDFDTDTMTRKKKGGRVVCPLSFSIPSSCCSDSSRHRTGSGEEEREEGGRESVYYFSSALLHRGEANSGHYTTLVREYSEGGGCGRWLELDDEEVKIVGEEEARTVMDGKQRDKVPYLLFYTTSSSRYSSTPADMLRLAPHKVAKHLAGQIRADILHADEQGLPASHPLSTSSAEADARASCQYRALLYPHLVHAYSDLSTTVSGLAPATVRGEGVVIEQKRGGSMTAWKKEALIALKAANTSEDEARLFVCFKGAHDIIEVDESTQLGEGDVIVVVKSVRDAVTVHIRYLSKLSGERGR